MPPLLGSVFYLLTSLACLAGCFATKPSEKVRAGATARAQGPHAGSDAVTSETSATASTINALRSTSLNRNEMIMK